MGETIQLGPFMLKWSALVFILSCAAAYFTIKLRLRSEKAIEKPILNTVINGIMIVILAWKFVPLLLDPSLIWRKPLSIVMQSGSLGDMLIGIVAAALYGVYSLRKQRIPILFMLDTIACGIVVGAAVNSLLIWQYGYATTVPWGISISNPEMNYHPIHVYKLIVVVFLFLWIWFRSGRLGSGRAFHNLLIFGSLGYMLISLFKPKQVFIWYLSLEQMIYLGLIVLGTSMPMIIKSARNDTY